MGSGRFVAAHAQTYAFHTRMSAARERGTPHFPAASSRLRSCTRVGVVRGELALALARTQERSGGSICSHRCGSRGQQLVRTTRAAALIHDDERIVHAARRRARTRQRADCARCKGEGYAALRTLPTQRRSQRTAQQRLSRAAWRLRGGACARACATSPSAAENARAGAALRACGRVFVRHTCPKPVPP